jgi:GDP-mannose pyrophosphatase NudK
MVPFIKNITEKILSKDWSVLKKVTYDYLKADGHWESQTREVYDRGDGVTILLYNKTRGTIILTKQLRFPTFVNGNAEGFLIETCAGKLDDESPEECAKREAEEETGYKIVDIKKAFELYMSPGSVTEKIYFFTASYEASMRVNEGGGLASEQENIEVLEIPFTEAVQMLNDHKIKDGKTVILLQFALIQGLLQ